jgi:hypothetical protein
MTIPQMLKAKRQQDFDTLPDVIREEIRLLVTWWNRYNWEGKENWIERICSASGLSDGLVINYVQAALRGDLMLPPNPYLA